MSLVKGKFGSHEIQAITRRNHPLEYLVGDVRSPALHISCYSRDANQ